MPTSILHSLTTFLSRRYNLNSSTPSNSRDRESLARDVAYSLKHIPAPTQSQQQQLDGTTASVEDGNIDHLETTLQELEQTLATCELSLEEFESKERFLYMRIERYRELIRERECLIRSSNAAGMQEGEERDGTTKVSGDDTDNDNVETGCEEEEEEDEEEVAASSVRSETQDGNDLNNKHKNLTQEQLTQLQHKHQQDQLNLQAVETIHAEIIVQIETIKRRIVELTEKQQDIVTKREECQEFLVEFAERGGHL